MILFNVNKKSQSEIIGIVIIVLLVTIGMLFMLTYKVNKQRNVKKTQVEEYKESKIASNYLIVLLDTYDVKCSSVNPLTMRDLLKNCLTSNDLYCMGGDACQVFSEELEEILDSSFGKWNMPYKLQISSDLLRNKNYTNSFLKKQSSFAKNNTFTFYSKDFECPKNDNNQEDCTKLDKSDLEYYKHIHFSMCSDEYMEPFISTENKRYSYHKILRSSGRAAIPIRGPAIKIQLDLCS